LKELAPAELLTHNREVGKIKFSKSIAFKIGTMKLSTVCEEAYGGEDRTVKGWLVLVSN